MGSQVLVMEIKDGKMDHVWADEAEYWEHQRVKSMSNGDMLAEFHETFNVVKDEAGTVLQIKLIEEEFEELMESDNKLNTLKEMADLVYVVYGLADRNGWDLDEAIRRVHISNMSKLDPVTRTPILREDGKILKSEAYKEPDLKDLVK